MAHFAQLSDYESSPGVRFVTYVGVVPNSKIIDPATGLESEALGIARQQRIHGTHTRWVQTSYNGSSRAKFAAIGDFYDETHDIFLSPKPFPSWSFDPATLAWAAPSPKPAVAGIESTTWNESTGAWNVTAILTKNEFDERFVQDEWTAIEDSTIPEVRRLRAKAFWLSAHIDLKDPRVIEGVMALEFVFKRADGVTPILPAGRAAAILSVA